MKRIQCPICTHPNRLNIDRELVRGSSCASVAKKYDLPYPSLYNHRQAHISRQLSQAMEKKQLESSFDLLKLIDRILTRTEDIFQRNYDAHRDGMALKAIAEQRNTIDLLNRISYNLHQARLTELEIKRLESKVTQDEEHDALIAENFRVLSPEEQHLFKQLLLKMAHKDPDMEIRPYERTEFPRVRDYTEAEEIVGES
jgi:hypothetical protein